MPNELLGDFCDIFPLNYSTAFFFLNSPNPNSVCVIPDPPGRLEFADKLSKKEEIEEMWDETNVPLNPNSLSRPKL